jgi:hypothetical protein
MMKGSSKPTRINWTLIVGGWIPGAIMGWYSFFGLLLYLLPTGAIWLVGEKILQKSKYIFLPAFSLLMGQILPFFVIRVYTYSLTPADILQTVVVAGMAIWLLFKQSLMSVFVVCVVQFLFIAINIFTLSNATSGSLAYQGLIVTIVWEVVTLFFVWVGYKLLETQTATRQHA